MIEVKSCKDINGRRISIGDKVRYVQLDKKFEEIRTVKSIWKSGYFIKLYVEETKHAWYMPKLCAEKVIDETA